MWYLYVSYCVSSHIHLNQQTDRRILELGFENKRYHCRSVDILQICIIFLQTWTATKWRPRLAQKIRLAIDSMTGRPRARLTPTDFEDQVWAWPSSDWLQRPGPCSLSVVAPPRLLLPTATCNLLWPRLTDQLWGTHCICLFLRSAWFVNSECVPCFCCWMRFWTIFWRTIELMK